MELAIFLSVMRKITPHSNSEAPSDDKQSDRFLRFDRSDQVCQVCQVCRFAGMIGSLDDPRSFVSSLPDSKGRT